MLAFQCNSEHREQLQVSRVTSESTVGTDPAGHSLGGLPNISGAPNQKLWKHSKTSIPTQAHHLVICARQATKKESPMPSALGRLMGRKRTRRLCSPPCAWPRRAGQGRGGSRQGCGKNQDPILQALLLSHWRLWVWGNVSGPDPYHPYLQRGSNASCILVQSRHLMAWWGERSWERVYFCQAGTGARCRFAWERRAGVTAEK